MRYDILHILYEYIIYLYTYIYVYINIYTHYALDSGCRALPIQVDQKSMWTKNPSWFCFQKGCHTLGMGNSPMIEILRPEVNSKNTRGF